MSPRAWRWPRVVLGVAVLAVLVWRLGAGPFLDGLRRVDVRVVAVGVLLGVVTTLCVACRWRAVSRALGVDLSLGAAVASSYRAQWLNSTLPGGVLGDVHRGVRHGRRAGDVGRGLRAVLWDRASGQVVSAVLTVAALFLLPSPVHPLVAMLVLAGCAGLVALVLDRARRHDSRLGVACRVAVADLRALGSHPTWPVVALTSAGATAGYVATLLVAAAAVGVHASVGRLVPLALLLLLAMSVPASVAGWGPREGVAAWAFGAAGLGASAGLSTAVVYGVMSLAATLPGTVVLVGSWLRRSRRLPTGPTVVPLEGARHG